MRPGLFGSWRLPAVVFAAALPILALGSLLEQFHARPVDGLRTVPQASLALPVSHHVAPGLDGAGTVRAGGAAAFGPERYTVFVAGRRVTVSDGRSTIDIRGVSVPVPDVPVRPGDLTYLPLRLSLRADARRVWEQGRARLAARPRAARATRLASKRTVAAARAATPAPAPAEPPVVFRGAVPYTQADVLLMAHVVDSEAANQPWDARLGVAAVIVNRVRAPDYPKTIQGVVYEPGQFDGVGTAMFYVAPDEEDVQAATAALEGEDPTGGALYFYNPAMTAPGSAIFDLPVLVTFGALRFAS